MRDLSAFQDLIPDRAPGEDESLTVIQLKRPVGVDGELPPELIEAWNVFYGSVVAAVGGADNLTVVSQLTISDAETDGPQLVTPDV